jgi:GntR family transcriptional regulator of vanillate catabolism
VAQDAGNSADIRGNWHTACIQGVAPLQPRFAEPAAEPESQTVRALLSLREMILGGELAPGARLTELGMVEKLGVSRTPVRAGLIRLQEEGLLDAVPGGGFAVRAFTEDEVCDSIELRGTLEGLAVRLAAERGVRPSTLRDMRAAVAAIDRVLAGVLTEDSFSAYVDLNEQFHRLLALAAQSALIERQIERAMRQPFASASAFVMVQSIDGQARDLHLAQAQHRAVVDALEAREGSRAEALMREHSRIAQRNLKTALGNRRALAKLPGGTLIR